MSKRVAVVLLSGGQDSATTLFYAMNFGEYDEIVPLTIRYGQRHQAEVQAAMNVAATAREFGKALGVDVRPPVVLSMTAISELGGSDLVGAGHLGEDGFSKDEKTGLPRSWVPGRNAMMLTLAASLAWKVRANDIWSGMCETDFSGYPDCRRRFVDAMEKALSLGVGQIMVDGEAWPWGIKVQTPLMFLTKHEEVLLADRMEGCMEALSMTITCYRGESPGCGTCPSCKLRKAGFERAGFRDPAEPA